MKLAPPATVKKKLTVPTVAVKKVAAPAQPKAETVEPKKQLSEVLLDQQIQLWEEKYKDLVPKADIIQMVRTSLLEDPEWVDKYPEMTLPMVRLFYNHVMLALGNFLIDQERAVKLDDIGILALKYRKSREGIAPCSIRRGDPKSYQARAKRVMTLRRPFQFEVDETGKPIITVTNPQPGDNDNDAAGNE